MESRGHWLAQHCCWSGVLSSVTFSLQDSASLSIKEQQFCGVFLKEQFCKVKSYRNYRKLTWNNFRNHLIYTNLSHLKLDWRKVKSKKKKIICNTSYTSPSSTPPHYESDTVTIHSKTPPVCPWPHTCPGTSESFFIRQWLSLTFPTSKEENFEILTERGFT